MVIVIPQMKVEEFVKGLDKQILGFHPCRVEAKQVILIVCCETFDRHDARIWFVLCASQFSPIVERQGNVRIGCAASNFSPFNSPCRMNVHLNDTNCGVQRFAGKHLLKIQGENIRIIHHGSKSSMGHLVDEGR